MKTSAAACQSILRQPAATAAAETISFYLPALASRFPVKFNPHYTEQTDRVANAWALAQFANGRDIPAPVRADNFTLWAAYAFPSVDAETLMQWCRFNALFTVLENRVESALDSVRVDAAISPWDDLVKSLYRMPCAADPMQLARDFGGRAEVRQALLMTCSLAKNMPRRMARHFYLAMARMVQAQRDEYQVLATAEMDILDYVEYRHVNYAIPLYTAAAQNMLDEQMPEAEWNDPARAQLDVLVAKQCSLVNDLYSFQKEQRERGERRPLVQAVTVLMEGHGLDVQGAVDALIALIQSYEDEYIRVRDQMLSEPMISPAFRQYCTRLEDIMSGNLRYMLLSPRYHGADFTGEWTGGLRNIAAPTGCADQQLAMAA